jgi:hypothetical protein
MATVRLVSPDLVKRTNDLVTKVRRERGIEKAMHDWIALMDANPVPQPGAEPPTEAAAEPPAAAPGEPDSNDR